MRKASTSPSKRAPSSLSVPVRLASHPSIKSSASATAASATSTATGVSPTKESATRPATPTASVARARVTHDAGPSRSAASRPRPYASATAMTRAQAVPARRPAAPSPAVSASRPSSTSWATNPLAGAARLTRIVFDVVVTRRGKVSRTFGGPYARGPGAVRQDAPTMALEAGTAMRQDDRAPFDRALRRARAAAYPPGEFVGQESFMTAGEIRALAIRAGVGPGVGVLD